MRALIDDALFATHANDFDLIGLIEFAFEGRHVVLTTPEFRRDDSSCAYRWILQHGPRLREDLLFGLEKSIHAEATGLRKLLTVQVSNHPDPTDPRSMSLPAARTLMSRPFLIIVENDRNDGAFVRVMLPPDWSALLRDAEAHQWVRFASGGGLGELTKHIERLDLQTRQWAVAVFDSDAWDPDRPSPESEAVGQRCVELKIAHHRLTRRASENYLPLQVLAKWVAHRFSHSRTPHRCYNALKKLSPTHRHHFNMKGGLYADSGSNPPRISELFATLPEPTRQALHSGFTDKVTSLFHEEFFTIQESWLINDNLSNERTALVHLIFSRL